MQDPRSGVVVKMSDYIKERRKKILWVGNSLKDIKALADELKESIGHQLWLVQSGSMPTDYKYMGIVGDGVFEIRVSDGQSAARCFYVTKLGDEVAVLHVFIKKAQKTPQSEIEIGQARYKSLVAKLKQKIEST